MAYHVTLKCVCCLALCPALVGCSPFETIDAGDPEPAPSMLVSERCWAGVDAPAPPADVETTENAQSIAKPAIAPDGDVQIQFETPCPDVFTPDFIASLQRALAARGYFTSVISSKMDAPTRVAISAYQAETGLQSDALSLETARRLGLVAVAYDREN